MGRWHKNLCGSAIQVSDSGLLLPSTEFNVVGERVLVSSMKEIQEILKGAVELGIENVPESLFTDSTFSTENMDFPYKGKLVSVPSCHH